MKYVERKPDYSGFYIMGEPSGKDPWVMPFSLFVDLEGTIAPGERFLKGTLKDRLGNEYEFAGMIGGKKFEIVSNIENEGIPSDFEYPDMMRFMGKAVASDVYFSGNVEGFFPRGIGDPEIREFIFVATSGYVNTEMN